MIFLHRKAEAEYRAAFRVIARGKETSVGLDNALTDGQANAHPAGGVSGERLGQRFPRLNGLAHLGQKAPCLLYTSDAADE